MGKSKVVDKDSKMCIQTSEKDGEGRIVKKFRAASNFVYKPVHQVMGAKDGYIVKVTTFPHNAQMYSLLYVTDVLGKIPENYHDGDVYVLSDEVQITGEGVLIPPSEREFAFLPDDHRLKVSIKTPLSKIPFQLAIPVMKLALKHNFVATMFTLGCFAMTMHADLVRKLDGSPTVVLVGPAGRGKTTGLLIAMACAGMHEIGCIKTVSKEKILQRASQCSIGVFLNDPPNISTLKELFIDFFNGASRDTISRGQEKIRCGLMITANDTVTGSARELRRLVYIPFVGASVMGTTAEEVAAHVAIKRMVHKGDFSSSIGTFIQLGSTFLNSGMDQIGEVYIPWVASHLKGCLPDCILPYATALWFSETLCKELFGGDSEILLKRYFEETIAPFVVAHQRNEQMQEPNNHEVSVGPNLVTQFKEDVAKLIENGEHDEVLQAVRYGQTKGNKCFVILPQFFADKTYDATNINSHLKRCKLGTSQARKTQKSGRSVRSTLLYTTAFEEEELDKLLKVLARSSDNGNCEPINGTEDENEVLGSLEGGVCEDSLQANGNEDEMEVPGSLQGGVGEDSIQGNENEDESNEVIGPLEGNEVFENEHLHVPRSVSSEGLRSNSLAKKKKLFKKKRKAKNTGGRLVQKKIAKRHFQQDHNWP